MLKFLLFLVAFSGSALSRPEVSTKVHLNLQKSLENTEDTVKIFVSFLGGTSSVLQAISETRFPTRDDRLIALAAALESNAESSQANVKTYLAQLQPSITFEVLWITNQIYVRNADLETVLGLADFQEVTEIREEEFINLDDPIPDGPIIYQRPNATEWGIVKIQAEEAQRLLTNATTNAAAIRVSTIDTGVRLTHEALVGNFLGEFGWYDPYEKTETPNDQNGHGTHTTGTICGKNGIGVYPDAEWIACKGCYTASCSQFALLECGQFITCPTSPDGTQKDCTKAPHLVSNSWGGGRGNTWFDDVIAAWHVAKIIPLFSIGNSGPSCNTANSPGDRDVIGVGSTTVEDAISSFSSVGPTIDGRMKPDVSAPGSNILSAYNTADNAYRALSGTSMACPHSAGLTALLLAYNPELTYDQVTKSMISGVERQPLQSSGKICSDIPDNEFPNHVFGQGRINAFNSLKGLIQDQS